MRSAGAKTRTDEKPPAPVRQVPRDQAAGRGWRVQVGYATAILLCALTMGLEFSHVLEWPVKAGYAAELYTRLQESLYLWFGTVGGTIYVLAVVMTVVLAATQWRAPETRAWLGAAAVVELVAVATFFVVVYPVNFHFPV